MAFARTYVRRIAHSCKLATSSQSQRQYTTSFVFADHDILTCSTFQRQGIQLCCRVYLRAVANIPELQPRMLDQSLHCLLVLRQSSLRKVCFQAPSSFPVIEPLQSERQLREVGLSVDTRAAIGVSAIFDIAAWHSSSSSLRV